MKRIAVFDADGHLHEVQADEIRICAPTAKCVKFWAHLGAALVVVAIGVFFMIYQGPTSAYFSVGLGLLTLGVGVLIPAPNYKSVSPRRVAATPRHHLTEIALNSEDSSPVPTPPDESTESTDVTIDVRE